MARPATWAEIAPLFKKHLKRFANLYRQWANSKTTDTVMRALSTGGLSLIIKDYEKGGGLMERSTTVPGYDNSSSSHACSGGHVWMWGGDLPDWPYDGMPCSCGAVKYDKRQALRDQIAELHRQLAELDAE